VLIAFFVTRPHVIASNHQGKILKKNVMTCKKSYLIISYLRSRHYKERSNRMLYRAAKQIDYASVRLPHCARNDMICNA
jgi:hypothetical protein